MNESLLTLEGYLARIELPRRIYAEAYLRWLNEPGAPPPQNIVGMSAQSAAALRRHIDQLRLGKCNYNFAAQGGSESLAK